MAKKPKVKPAKNRKPGRPKRVDRVIIAERDYGTIGDMHLTGHTDQEIAEHYGCENTTISHHLRKFIRPQWQEKSAVSVEDVIAELEAIKRLAWNQFRSDSVTEVREMTEESILEEATTKRGRPKKDKLELIRRVTSRVKKQGNLGWLQVVQWCIEERAKILGFYKRDDSGKDAAPVIPTILVEVKSRQEANRVLSYRDFTKAAAGSKN